MVTVQGSGTQADPYTYWSGTLYEFIRTTGLNGKYVQQNAHIILSGGYDDGEDGGIYISAVTGGGLNNSMDSDGFNLNGYATVLGNVTFRIFEWDPSGDYPHIINFTVIAPPSYTHTITYNGNGASNGSTPNTVVTDTNSGNTNVTLANNGYTRPGYTFTGWNVNGIVYQPGQSIPVGPNATVTAYAQWVLNVASVPVKVNGSWTSANVKTKVNGTWTDVKKVFVKVNGVWQQTR